MNKKTEKNFYIELNKTVVFFAVILLLAILIEGFITAALLRNSADKSTTLLINQIESVSQDNEKIAVEAVEEQKRIYISYARTIAYVLSEDPALAGDKESLVKFAELMKIDEIHIFNAKGTIIAGTVPSYYGLDFSSGEQIGYFKAMLDDKSLSMCQDVTPNTAEGKNMMYAITWNEAGTMMVQVGIEPGRLLEELSDTSIANVIDSIPIIEGFNIYAVDENTKMVVSSTNKGLGEYKVSIDPSKLNLSGKSEGSGIVKINKVPYFFNYKHISGYIIAVAYDMNSSWKSFIVPLVMITVFLLVAGAIILRLIYKLSFANEEKENQINHEREMLSELNLLISAINTVYPCVTKGDLTDNTFKSILADDLSRNQVKEIKTLNELIEYIAMRAPDNGQREAYLEHFSVDKQIAAYERGEKTISYVHQQLSEDGKYHWMSTRVIFMEEGDHIVQIALDRCVDEEINEQEKLQEVIDRAEAANAAKTTFLNNMSHDIRTPMNAILGFTGLMEKEIDNPEVLKTYLDKVQISGEYLLTLINNMLEVARIDSGKETIDECFADLTDERCSVIPMLESEIKKKKLTFTNHMDIQHKYVFADIEKIREITMNLMSNAIKYTPEGGKIHMEFTEIPCEREGYATYVNVISDTGIGMSEDFVNHIFDSFSRERNTTESKVIGTGLGMSIVKKLVDLMGGTIIVESEPGKGSNFTVTMNHRIIENPEVYLEKKQEEVADSEADFGGKRILLAEDNELNAEIAVTILEEMGIKVDHVWDGVECINKLNESVNGYYDLILMDVQMPHLDGYEATRRIRELPDAKKANIPIVAMTANAFEEDKKNAYNAGMNGHLAKPIVISDLTSILNFVLNC